MQERNDSNTIVNDFRNCLILDPLGYVCKNDKQPPLKNHCLFLLFTIFLPPKVLQS